MKSWITDTETTERFPILTRGNADEVGPEPFSPLGWTLAWEKGAAPGVADAWTHLGAFRPEEFRWPVPEVFGCWGGYFYNQVSVGRVFGVRAPGGSPDAIDQAYFGSKSVVPPYESDPRDEDEELTKQVGQKISWVMSAESFPQLDHLVARTRKWAAERPDLASMTDEELVAYGRASSLRLRETWDIYAQVLVAASIGPGAVQAIAGALGRPEAVVAVFTALGNVETAGTSDWMWELGRTVHNSPELQVEFDAGVDGLLDRLRRAGTPAATEFLAAFDGLIEEYGHRGPNEWDLMPDCWLTRPELALSLIDRLRLQSDDQAPTIRGAVAAQTRERLTAELFSLAAGDAETHSTLQAAIRSGRLFLQLREAGKDAAVRVMLEAKLPFFELGRRMAERGALDDSKHLFMLLDSELDEFVSKPDAWRDSLAQRARDFRELAELEPPYVVTQGNPVPPISTWPKRGHAKATTTAVPGDVLQGIGTSPGTSIGRARVVVDLSRATDIEPGDILVCGSTDPSWVPLFMVAGAVVCEIGAMGSHAAIVSRELGVPCVSSVDGARNRIADGSLIEVDGLRGTVKVRKEEIA